MPSNLPKNDSDTDLHDPLDQNREENVIFEEVIEAATDTAEVEAAEEAAINIDTEVAQEATENTELTEEDEEVLKEVKEAAEALEEGGSARKHKNRESTSEKAKKAASNRQSTSEKAKISQAEHQRHLDPLRLRGKKYRAKAALVDRNKTYSVEEALELVKQASTATFDAAVELHAKVKSDSVRGTVVLPNGSGKTRKVAVATDEVIEQIANGKMDFDVLLATPAQMPKLAKYAKLLGPKGLMPSPKAGTVTEDIEKAKEEIGGGRVEYRADKNGVVHLSIGRVSFPVEKLVENFKAIEQVLISAKILSLSLAPTMGPGVKVALER